jgi:hypothetical protein
MLPTVPEHIGLALGVRVRGLTIPVLHEIPAPECLGSVWSRRPGGFAGVGVVSALTGSARSGRIGQAFDPA